MLKFLLLLTAFASLRAEVTDWFTGRWLPVVLYPNILYEPMCNWHDVSFNRIDTCNCGKKGNTDVLDFKNLDTNETDTQAVIVINSADEIAEVVTMNCTCAYANGSVRDKHPIALQKLNENTYATYETTIPRLSSDREPTMAFVIVKTVPKLKELRDLIYSVGNLKTRKPGLLCEPSLFKSGS